MKTLLIYSLSLTLINAGCSSDLSDQKVIINKIGSEIDSGNLTTAKMMADSLKRTTMDERTLWEADSLYQVAERIPVDFSLTEEQVLLQLHKYSDENFNTSRMKEWEAKGWLEYRIIDGEKKYFKSAVSNLILLRYFNLDRIKTDSAKAKDPRIIFRRKQAESIISSSLNHEPVNPVKMEITYTITVKPDAVPPGETVKCWLPFPKENHDRQSEVYLNGLPDDEYFLVAPDSLPHRSLYMEKKASPGEPVVFSAAFSFISSGQYFDPSDIRNTKYDKRSDIYRKHTPDLPPHINFSDKVKRLTDSIVGDEMNPYETVKKIYIWIIDNIPWINALEYSIMPDIPEYVITRRRGDCGMQTFLFMSMLRYRGIPVRWQSGWILQPEVNTIHDWCEVYYEGTGWIPVDLYYGLQYSQDKKVREFYITGIDSYRLIVNDGIAGELYPAKKYLRSDPYDFQRGEVEWSGGNLYFDKWDYTMKITYN